jgi:probable HAF family extracellular repeat protein
LPPALRLPAPLPPGSTYITDASSSLRRPADFSGYKGNSLGTLSGSTITYPAGLNTSGLAVGATCCASDGTYQRAFLYNTTNGLADIGGLTGSTYNFADAINDSNAIVGYSLVGGHFHAVSFSSSGASTVDLGGLPGSSGFDNVAYAVNSTGAVVGSSQTATFSTYAVTFSNGSAQDLGTLPHPYPNSVYSVATGINTSGQASGYSYGINGGRAVLFSNGTVTNLGTLGGIFSDGNQFSFASAINSLGHIVGGSQAVVNGVNEFHAFLYANGTMQDLGTYAGGHYSYATAINDSDDVVGIACDGSNQCSEFLYTPASGLQALTATLPSGQFGYQATSINACGEIAGVGTVKKTYGGAIWTPLHSNC